MQVLKANIHKERSQSNQHATLRYKSEVKYNVNYNALHLHTDGLPSKTLKMELREIRNLIEPMVRNSIRVIQSISSVW